jgi:hypothetical protein
MKIQLLRHHFERKKLSSIMNYDTYVYLLEWYATEYRAHQQFKVPFEDWIYAKTSNREYLSKWLENFIVKYLKITKPEWIVHKVDNRGKEIVSRTQTTRPNGIVDVTFKREGWKKNANQIVGEPDIRCKRPMQIDLYFEVKIGNDRLSDAQKDFIAKGYGEVVIVKKVEDFLNYMKC